MSAFALLKSMTSKFSYDIKKEVKNRDQIGVGTFQLPENAIEWVTEVLKTGRLSYGPFSERFEKKFANLHDCKFGIFTNSGTSALTVSLAALKEKYFWKEGDEVILPAVTFISTANVVVQLGLKPVFVDVDPIFYCLDPKKLEQSITSKTRCIIPVHVFGGSSDMDPILQIQNQHKLSLVEDACEALLTRYKGKMLGSFGELSCFSTHTSHLLTTGVGGMALTKDPELETLLRSYIYHGRDPSYLKIDDDQTEDEQALEKIVANRFHFPRMGYSFRLTEMEAALGLAGLQGIEEILRIRRANANFLKDSLLEFSDHIQLPSVRENCEHSFMMFPILLKNRKKNDLVMLLEKNRIETRDMLSLVNQPLYREYFTKGFSVSRKIDENGFYLGCHQSLKKSDLEKIVEVLKEYFKGL
jgi:perosamine synthetase